MFAQIWEFLGPRSRCPGLSTFGWPPRPPFLPLSVDTRLALFETLQLVNNSHWRVKKLFILFENNIKNIRMKTIFKVMSLHCVPYIIYWMQAELKFYIETCCQIIWVNFTNMVAIFFSKRTSTFGLPPSPCAHLSTFTWPSDPPNVWTSFMDGS